MDNKKDMKDNTFVLFKNKDKKKDTSPDYTGHIMIDGNRKRLSSWINETKSGDKYMKGSISDYQETNNQDKDDF